MSSLVTLKLITAKKPTNQPAIVSQRSKLSKRITEQIELASAQAQGGFYASKRLKSVLGADGLRRTVEVTKRVKPWWFVSDSGKVCLNVRYGSKLIELAKGKSAIEIASADDLIKTLDIIKVAVMAGELDTQIEAVSGQLRAGFRR